MVTEIRNDAGVFGPESMMWRINREMFTLFGGARALLMQAAHPLVAAGARQTGFYARDPWKRLLRTVQLQLIMAFGTEDEAMRTADRINKLHEKVKGIDPVTGLEYDGLDPDLLLWVHATLEQSSIMFYEKTVGPLTSAEKEQYHQENLKAAEIVLLPRSHVPATYAETNAYIDEVVAGNDLLLTEVALEVANLMRGGPVPYPIKPVWLFINFAAKGTLPFRLQELYGVEWDGKRQKWLDLNLAFLRKARPFLPRRMNTVMPAVWAERRLRGEAVDMIEAARRARRNM
jgi:uncharacterized protein (DUF2236 family)